MVSLIKSTSVTRTVEELRLSHQLNCRWLGSRLEAEVASILEDTPQLVKLGLTLQFRDTLCRAARQLQENLDRRKPLRCLIDHMVKTVL